MTENEDRQTGSRWNVTISLREEYVQLLELLEKEHQKRHLFANILEAFQLEVMKRRMEGLSIFESLLIERGNSNYTMYFYENQLVDIDTLAKELDVSRRVIAYTMVAKFAQRLYEARSAEQHELMPKLRELEKDNKKTYEELLAHTEQGKQEVVELLKAQNKAKKGK